MMNPMTLLRQNLEKERPLRAFTLVETLVAITIVLTAITGPLYVVQQSLSASRHAREQLVASSLAQEGVEFVRAIRDSNYIYNMTTGGARAWFAGLDGTAGSSGTYANCITGDCVIDSTQNTVSRTVAPLYLSTTGLYNQAGAGTATGFTRTVRLTAVSVDEMAIVVTVSWISKGQTRSVVLNEHLYNWL